MRMLAFLIATMSLWNSAISQNLKEQFERFKSTQEKSFNQFAEEADREFAEHLLNSWEEFQPTRHSPDEVKPKPRKLPFADTAKIKNIRLPQRIDDFIRFDEELIMPTHHKKEDYDEDYLSASFDFFGQRTRVLYARELDYSIDEISPEEISKFWIGVSESNYQNTLHEMERIKLELGLNDFGFYLLAKHLAEAISNSRSSQRLLIWFLMSKSKYKVRIGFNEDDLFLLLSSRVKLYGQQFLTIQGTDYYVFEYEGAKIYSYKEDYPQAYRTIDFTVARPLKLKRNIAYRSVNFEFKGITHSLDVAYNRNAIDFYQFFPKMELGSYFQSSASFVTIESLRDVLLPIMEDFDEEESVSFLLTLVQTGFEYQIDEVQFGSEKVFFPEEMLFYEFSDCEDRSVFFSYLVKSLLGMDVIGIEYPSHVATAVKFDDDQTGDHYVFENDQYIVCDPTYIGAPLGKLLKGQEMVEAVIIPGSNKLFSINLDLLTELKVTGDHDQVWSFESGREVFLVLNYFDSLSIQQDRFLTPSRSAVYSKFRDGKLIWSGSLGENNIVLDVKLSSDGSLYMLYEKKGQAIKSTFITEIGVSGSPTWTKVLPYKKTTSEQANVSLMLFSLDGKFITSRSYLETTLFEINRLAIRNNTLLVFAPINQAL